MKLTRTLALTSPRMEGADVTHAQKVLSSTAPGTKFGNFKPGPVDGIFGVQTSTACERAKYWLGYETKNIKPNYGQQLEDFLTGTKPLPAAYKTRRAARLKKEADKPLRVKAFARAVAELGTKESPPDTNRVKYSTWYGIRGPWCAMFVTWCYVMAGSTKTFRKGQRYASVPLMIEDARGRDWQLRVLSKDEVKQGDIVTFDWEGGGMGKSVWLSDHVGLFNRWTNKSKGEFTTIEGNTAVGNDSNGGEVMRRSRKLSQVSCFMRTET